MKPRAQSGAGSCSIRPWMAATSPTVSTPRLARPAETASMTPRPRQKMSAWPRLSTDTVRTSLTAEGEDTQAHAYVHNDAGRMQLYENRKK